MGSADRFWSIVIELSPDDKDAKNRHIFTNATRVSEMNAAFDKKDGVVWLWGCNFNKAFLIIFAAMRRSGKYKSGGLKDSVKFTLGFQEEKKRTPTQQDLQHLIFTQVWEQSRQYGKSAVKKRLNFISG